MTTRISKTTQWKLLITFFFLLLNGVLIFTLSQGVLAETRALSDQQDRELQEAQLLLIKEKELETGKLSLVKLKEDVKDFEQRVPLQLDTPQLALDVYQFTLDHGLTPEVISFGDVLAIPAGDDPKETSKENSEKLFALDVEYRLRGSAEKAEAFLQDLSQMTPVQLALKGVEMNQAENGELELRLTLRHYSLSPEIRHRTYESYSFGDALSRRETLQDLFSAFTPGSTLTLPQP